MKKEKMIRSFETISKYDVYSKYNNSLDKKFKDKSLKSFINSLKYFKPKQKEPFLVEFSKKYPYDFESKKYNDEENQMSIKIEEYRRIKEEKEKERQERLNSSKFEKYELRSSFSTKRYNKPDFPDPFKYNPNFDYIFKKVPSFKISPKKYEGIRLQKVKDIQNKSIQDKKENSTISNSNISNEENEINDNRDENKNINSKSSNSVSDIHYFRLNKKENNLDLPLITSTNIISSLKKEINERQNTISFKDNHAIRFSKYLPRKAKLRETNNKVSYIEPHNYALDMKKGFDFGKMQSRDEKSILNMPSLEVPPSNKYSPKYNLVENSSKNVIFSPFGSNKNNKKVLLQKMLGSYKVFFDYQFIDNSKLFNDKDIINQKLIINHNIHP